MMHGKELNVVFFNYSYLSPDKQQLGFFFKLISYMGKYFDL
jgi:hypothetical protein